MSGNLIEAIRRSSYVIEGIGNGAWGSSIAIAPTWIVTAKHVINAVGGKFRIYSEYTGRAVRPKRTVLDPRGKDIVAIEVDSVPNYVPPSPYPYTHYQPNDTVYSWASASAVELVRPILITAGFIAGQSIVVRDADYAISMGVQRGCSGAGVVHQSGYVIGVVSSALTPATELPISERSVVYVVDVYPIAKQLGIVKTSGEKATTSPINWHWWSHEIMGAVVGFAVGRVLSEVTQ